MYRILFVCLGNICRSPMAEFVLRDMAAKAGGADRLYIESGATSSWELGNPVYPPAKKKLAEHGISCAGKTARRIDRRDYDRFDLIIGMDNANMRDMKELFDGDKQNKCRLLMDYTARPGEVSDPWFTGDFDAAWRDIEEGCRGLLESLTGGQNSLV